MTRKEARPKIVLANSPHTPWKRRLTIAASALAVISTCLVARHFMGSSAAEAQISNPFRGQPAKEQPAATAAAPAPDKQQQGAQQVSAQGPARERPKHDVMAVVNGQDIRREALAAACVERYGEETLEGLVNKRLILHHCKNRQIEVTDQEIDAEVDRMAARFKIGRAQWLDMLERERGVNAEQYKRDILWPTLALRKLAAKDLVVSDQQLQEAYEAQFGPAMKCRLIVVADRAQADKLRRQLIDNPADFARLAMQSSQDVNSASIGGLIQPIRHHVGDPAIEKEVFSLQANQISQIIPVGDQFAILKCEGQVPPRNVPMENVKAELTEQIKEDKLRDVASGLFKQLQDSSTIQNVWNTPELRAQMPGIVATINGEQIRYEELAEECMLRYGEEVLDVEISHLLLQQALKRANLAVSEQDLNEEMAHGAKLSGVVDAGGNPDMDKWIHMATEEQGVTKDQYLSDSVWPSAALKKLAGGTIQVTDEDIKKGFDANYAERIRCRAIVLGTMRRAQEVWAKARQNTSVDYFGDLAEEYSIEPTSKSLRGEVPPIRRFGGQPQLEDAAFQLQPGELSGIIQLGDKFVILKCEGRTDPVEVNPQEVRDILYQDIFEKKLRVTMGEKFEEIRKQARIDNFLAGTSQAPDRVKGDAPAGSQPRVDSAVRPTSGPPAR